MVVLMANAALVGSFSGATAANKFKRIYSFCIDYPTCSDGSGANTSLTRDSNGNFYGATGSGGANNEGVVYQLKPNGAETVLYSFCSLPVCADGELVRGNLIADVQGNLYSTTMWGGSAHDGVVYKLTHSRHTPWKLTVLYNFCSKANCSDGSQPNAGLTYQGIETGALYDGASPLYGTTTVGGSSDTGVAYRLTFLPGKKKPKYDVIYDFCSQANCSDGANVYSSLAPDANGNLFGVAGGGNNNDGVAFELLPNGNDGFDETVLYAFCQLVDCGDGANPVGIIADYASGNLFGVTGNGGTGGNAGTIFKIVPTGTNSVETVLHSFCSEQNCTDGGYPSAGVIIRANGDLFGTTSYYGTSFDAGIVYKLHGTTLTVLHDFCSEFTCPDGSDPISTLIFDDAGNLYGTAVSGGDSGVGGVAFKITKP
jgi:uncharacterized repeat protein (TIGR03803 family)